ncbi:MAG: DUF1974 domain-containing protein, partial [Limnobacter sp.]|nr:DUF1974 domain-containing protein [Limnobacter sp.]
RVRRQFGMPICDMEGVQEKLAELAGMAYLAEAARVYAVSALDSGEQPPVVSAVWKAYLTELARKQGMNAMDVLSGAGVMQGPNNIIGRSYCSAPVGITVEGANIMTRSLIVFGQGAVRCHPYAMKIVNALEANDLQAFSANLRGWVIDMVINTGRLIGLTATRGYLADVPAVDGLKPYLRKLAWASSRFAYLTDLALITVGGQLKVRQQLTGYFADALAWQLLAVSTVRRYLAEGEIKEDLPLAQYALETCMENIQLAFEAIYANFGTNPVGWWLRTVGYVGLRMNPLAGAGKDRLMARVAKTIVRSGPQFDRLAGDLYLPEAAVNGAGEAAELEKTVGVKRLMAAFYAVEEAQAVESKLKAARRQGKLEKASTPDMAKQALAQGIITEAEQQNLERAERLALEAIMVDDFTPQEFLVMRPLTRPLTFQALVPMRHKAVRKLQRWATRLLKKQQNALFF